MNWSKAIKAMAEGKKVRRGYWAPGYYISATDTNTENDYFWIRFIDAQDWELYEEPIPTEEFTRNYEQLLRETLAEALINMADHLMRKGE